MVEVIGPNRLPDFSVNRRILPYIDSFLFLRRFLENRTHCEFLNGSDACLIVSAVRSTSDVSAMFRFTLREMVPDTINKRIRRPSIYKKGERWDLLGNDCGPRALFNYVDNAMSEILTDLLV